MKLVLANKFITSWNFNGDLRISLGEVGMSTSVINSYDHGFMAKRILSRALKECGDKRSTLSCDLECKMITNSIRLRLRSSDEEKNNILKKLADLFNDDIKVTVALTAEMKKSMKKYFLVSGMRISWCGKERVCSANESLSSYTLWWWNHHFCHVLRKALRMKMEVTAEICPQIVFDALVAFEENAVAKKNKKLLGEGIASDVVIVAGNGKEFRCHKCFLFEASPVFQRMFGSGLQESQTGQVQIPEMSEEGMKAFLSYLYYEDIKELRTMNREIAFELLYCAHKYQVSKLEALVIKHLAKKREEGLTIDLAFRMFTLVKNIEAAHELKEISVRVLKLKLNELEELPEYKDLFKKSPNDAMELCGLLAKTSLG